MVSLFFLPGCFVRNWFAKPPTPAPTAKNLPDKVPALLEFADAKIATAVSAADLSEAVAALDKADKLLDRNKPVVAPSEIHIRLAMAAFLISEQTDDKDQKLAWIGKGLPAAEAAARERPDRVEGYYYQAVMKGRRAELGELRELVELRDIMNLGLKAAEIDSSYREGAPLRFLAMLYVKAPSWPTGIGDVDLGIKYAEKALAISDYPLNHMILAEALAEAEDKERARTELGIVLSAPKVGEWAKEAERWCTRARKILSELNEQ